MSLHTTNYTNTFISVADDCPVAAGAVPPEKANPTAATILYRTIADHPYRFTSDELLFAVFAQKNGVAEQDREAERHRYFSKGQPCLRAAALGKSYGWGTHHDAQGRVALYGVGSPEYQRLSRDPGLVQLKAMRSSK